MDNKLINSDTLEELSAQQKERGHKIVLCYGHFNVIHPGHLRFLQQAKNSGDILFAAVVSDEIFNPTNQQFKYSESDRCASVAAINSVDYVFCLTELDILESINTIKPDVFILGKEFEEERRGEVEDLIQSVRSLNGKVIFHAGETHYSSSDFLFEDQSSIKFKRKRKFCETISALGISISELKKKVANYNNCRLLVIGDTIVDQFVACEALGMSAEAPVLVMRELEDKEFIGGASIIAGHIQALGGHCNYLSVVGNDPAANFVKRYFKDSNINACLIEDRSRPTTYKIRYMVDKQKMFRVSRLKEHRLAKDIEREIIKNLHKLSDDCDGILVSDFVYGVVTDNILNEINNIAIKKNLKLFGDLQCSSQIGNVGKFKEFDLITPTEREARLALNNNEDGVEWIAHRLMESTNSKNLILKLGADGFIAYKGFNGEKIEGASQHFPALSVNPIDTAGAGDSLISNMALGLCTGLNVMESAVLSNCVATIAVQSLGNVPVTQEKLYRFLDQLDLTSNLLDDTLIQ